MLKSGCGCRACNGLDPNWKKPKALAIGGFLGAGKTTFVNYLLETASLANVDVLVREYGAVSVDDQLINLGKEHIHVFQNLSFHHDTQLQLYDYMHGMLHNNKDQSVHPFDFLFLEASGLDEPEYLVELFDLGQMPQLYDFGGYITLVDGEYWRENFEEYSLSIRQVAYADVIIINKVDQITAAGLQELELRLRGINAYAPILHAQYGEVDPEPIFTVNVYDQLKYCEKTEETGMDPIKTIVLTEDRPMDKQKINAWLQKLFKDSGWHILRSKGFFQFAEDDYRYEFQAVRRSFHSKADKQWDEDEKRKSTVVLIGDDLPDRAELMKSFSACVSESPLITTTRKKENINNGFQRILFERPRRRV